MRKVSLKTLSNFPSSSKQYYKGKKVFELTIRIIVDFDPIGDNFVNGLLYHARIIDENNAM